MEQLAELRSKTRLHSPLYWARPSPRRSHRLRDAGGKTQEKAPRLPAITLLTEQDGLEKRLERNAEPLRAGGDSTGKLPQSAIGREHPRKVMEGITSAERSLKKERPLESDGVAGEGPGAQGPQKLEVLQLVQCIVQGKTQRQAGNSCMSGQRCVCVCHPCA